MWDISFDKGGSQSELAAKVVYEQGNKEMYDNQTSEYTCKSLVFI